MRACVFIPISLSSARVVVTSLPPVGPRRLGRRRLSSSRGWCFYSHGANWPGVGVDISDAPVARLRSCRNRGVDRRTAEEPPRGALERSDSDALIAQAALSICGLSLKPLAEALPAAVRNKAKSNGRILGSSLPFPQRRWGRVERLSQPSGTSGSHFSRAGILRTTGRTEILCQRL